MEKKEFEAFLQKNGLSQRVVAESIGVSGSLISQMLAGTYKGNSEAVMNRLQLFVENYNPKEAKSQTVELDSFQSSMGFMGEFAHMSGFFLMVGESGYGKTTTIKEFVKRNPNAVLLEARVSINTSKLIKELARKLKISVGREHTDDIFLEIANTLKKRHITLIIDEAEYLKVNALEMVRRIYDFSGATIFLVGTPKLLKNIIGEDSKNPQIFGRIKRLYKFRSISKSDIGRFFEDKYDIKLDREKLELVESATGGSIRLCDNIGEAMEWMRKGDEGIDISECLERAFETIIISSELKGA